MEYWGRGHSESQILELVNSQAGLSEYASQDADRNLSISWHDCHTHTLVGGLCVFYVASSLADLREARGLQLPFDSG